MGILSSVIVKPCIEKLALPAPWPGYDRKHPNLVFIGNSQKFPIACMKYIKPGPKIILYSHGNASDISHMHSFLSKLSDDVNISVISYDYYGYGLSQGVASEQGCIEAICEVYKYLIEIGYSSENILFYGTSIGTGPSVYLAAELSKAKCFFKGCVLQTPYTSVVGVVSQAQECTSYQMASICTNPNIFRTREIISQVLSPVVIIHGLKDELIAYNHAVMLHDILQKAGRLSTLITLPNATHNSIETQYYPELLNSLTTMLV